MKTENPKGRFRAAFARAKRRVEGMDKIDGCTVADRALDDGLRTVMTAIESGMTAGDWGPVADALVMLQQIEFAHRPDELKRLGPYMAKEWE